MKGRDIYSYSFLPGQPMMLVLVGRFFHWSERATKMSVIKCFGEVTFLAKAQSSKPGWFIAFCQDYINFLQFSEFLNKDA